eukprot:g4841.t1
MSSFKGTLDRVCLKRSRDAEPVAKSYTADESDSPRRRMTKIWRDAASVDVAERRSGNCVLLMLNSIGNEVPSNRALYNLDTQCLNIKCGENLKVHFTLKHASLSGSNIRFAVQLPSGETKDVHFIRDETCGEDVYGRLYPGEPGIFLAYVNGSSVQLRFKDIDLSGKIVFQASFKFTMLENTRDLGSYIPNLAKQLGTGAEAGVYKCYVLGSGEAHALRVSRKTKDVVSKALGLQRLLAGRKICGRNIVPKIYDVFDRDGFTYEVHEFIPDGDLFEAIKKNSFDWYDCENTLQPNKFNEILSIVVQMLKILQILHEEGISHLDLSPENFMLRQSNDGNIDLLVIDFGHAEQNLSGITGRKGKPLYNAPEIVEYEVFKSLKNFDECFACQKYEGLNVSPFDHKADCFSIGQILFVLLYNKHPTYREDVRQGIFKLAPHQTAYFNTLLTNLLIRNPQHRWSADDALEHIQGVIPKPEVTLGHSYIHGGMWGHDYEDAGLLEHANFG